MAVELNILLLEDNAGDAFLIQELLLNDEFHRYNFTHVEQLSEALILVKERSFDLGLIDLGLPDSSGVDTLKKICQTAPSIPYVVLTGNDNENGGVDSVKAGAQDYIPKGQLSTDLLSRVCRYAIERHQGQVTIRQSESLLRSTLDSLSARIAILDESGLIVATNKVWQDFEKKNSRLTGTIGEGDNYFDALSSPARQKHPSKSFLEGIKKVLAGDLDHFDMEYMEQISSEMHWFLGRVMPYSGGEVHRVVLAYEDICARKKSEEALRVNEERLRTILENLTSKVILLDCDLKVLWANKYARKITEKENVHLIGSTCHEVWFNQNTTCEDCPVRLAFKTGKVQNKTLVMADGRTWRVLGCPVFSKDGEIENVIELSEDITEIVNMEGKLQQTQKMESLGMLAGGIAHDFNNILTAILGYTDLCREKKTKDKDMVADLEEVYRAGTRAKDLVQQILTFSRRVKIEPTPLQMHLIVDEALKMLRSTLPTTVKIETEIDTKTCAVLADATQIHQIVINLCTNASHAMEPIGGVLSVKLSEFKPSKHFFLLYPHLLPGKYLQLVVTDSGCGMTAETISSIFDPYFTTKELGEGTGLGLAVTHGIVKESGGEILVDSAIGRGSVFKILLPCVKASEVEKSSEADEPYLFSAKKERILLVDDDRSVLNLTSRYLEKYGYRVSAHSDSLDALADFEASPHSFDLVLTDVTMPDLPGNRLAEKILKSRPEIPIVLMTGYSKVVNEETAKQTGVHDLLFKPIPLTTLLVKLKDIFSKS